MSKKKIKKLKKTLVEKMLDQHKIPYKQASFKAEVVGDTYHMDASILGDDEKLVYKTLVATGNKTGPLVGVVPITDHLSMKKLAKISGNKKCEMLPLKKLEKTTGYVHGANTPIGIYERLHFPIYVDDSMAQAAKVAVSSGEVGRSVWLKPQDLIDLVHAKMTDLRE